MGGFWKLAAMSAVIGAGLAIVWQAQKGLSNVPPAETTASTAASAEDSPAAPAFAPVPNGPSPESLTPLLKPLAETTRSVAAASVPPEPAQEAGPTPAEPDRTPPVARYQRGLDFTKRPPTEDPFTTEAPANSETATAEADSQPPAPLQIDVDAAAVMIDPVPEPSEPVTLTVGTVGEDTPREPIVPVAAEEEDPFANTAPPEIGAAAEPVKLPPPKPRTAAAPKAEPLAEDDPFGPVPARIPASDTPKPVEDDDPFATQPTPQSATSTPPASDVPTIELGDPAEMAPARPRPRLPIDLDDPANVPPPRSPRANNRLQEQNPPAPLSVDPVPASTPRKSTGPNDALLGDGQVTADAPRGVQEPRLTIEKIAPAKAALGQELVYAVVVKNTGGSPASQVVVEDRIPKGARLIGTHPRAELVDKRLIWKLGTLQPNDERKISIKVVPEEEGPLGSVAKVNFVSEVAAEIVITAPQLKLRVSAPGSVTMGETVKVVFTVSNTGEGNASNVILRSVLPDGLQHPSGSDLEYVIGDLPSKQSRDVPLELVATRPGRITQRASVTGEGNVSADADTLIEIQGEQLVLTRRGQSRAIVGRASVFTNQVLNEGEQPVQRVKVAEVVPAGFEFVEASDGGAFDQATRTISWTVGPLPPGEEAAVTAKLLPKAAGQYEGTVTAAGPTGSVAKVKASVAVDGYPSLSLEPMGNERVLAVGERLTSQVQIKNNGTAPAAGVGLTIEVPPELKIVSAKGPATYQVIGQRVVFDAVNELAPRDRATYEVAVEALTPGDARLELQISAEHLRRPVRHEEAVQIVGDVQ